MEQPKLINNINERVVDDLKERLSKGSRISIAAASFSIYAFEALKKELEDIDELRFIFTSPTFIKENQRKRSANTTFPNSIGNANSMVRSLKSDFVTSCHKKLSPRSVQHGFARK